MVDKEAIKSFKQFGKRQIEKANPSHFIEFYKILKPMIKVYFPNQEISDLHSVLSKGLEIGDYIINQIAEYEERLPQIKQNSEMIRMPANTVNLFHIVQDIENEKYFGGVPISGTDKSLSYTEFLDVAYHIDLITVKKYVRCNENFAAFNAEEPVNDLKN